MKQSKILRIENSNFQAKTILNIMAQHTTNTNMSWVQQ